MKGRLQADPGMEFVLTALGLEQARVRAGIKKDNKSVPKSWVEKGYVSLVKLEKEEN